MKELNWIKQNNASLWQTKFKKFELSRSLNWRRFCRKLVWFTVLILLRLEMLFNYLMVIVIDDGYLLLHLIKKLAQKVQLNRPYETESKIGVQPKCCMIVFVLHWSNTAYQMILWNSWNLNCERKKETLRSISI
jgi:hypothetical protein